MPQTTNVLITGCTRGIGYGLAAYYLQRPAHLVIAAVRNPKSAAAQALTALKHGTDSSLILTKIDSADFGDSKTAVQSLAADHDIDHLDIVVANAGISKYFGPALTTDINECTDHFNVNVLGPLVLFQATAPMLQRSQSVPKFVTMSSGAGSISNVDKLPVENTAYGASKAALNFVTRRIHYENEWLIAFPVNPGWLQTDLGNHAATSSGMAQAPVSVEDGVKGLAAVIDKATRQETSGRFMNAEGGELPW